MPFPASTQFMGKACQWLHWRQWNSRPHSEKVLGIWRVVFFQRAAKVVDMPWTISVGNDLRMPETVGPRNIGVNFVNWYMTKLHQAAHSERISAMAFFQVANLLAPPPSVMRPRVVLSVLKGNLT